MPKNPTLMAKQPGTPSTDSILPTTTRKREHRYQINRDLSQVIRLKEYYIPGDGMCGITALGLNIDEVFHNLIQVINTESHEKYKLIREIILTEMSICFDDEVDRARFKEFDDNFELIVTAAANNPNLKSAYLRSQMETYLKCHQQGMKENRQRWYLLTPQHRRLNNPVYQMNESRILTAIAAYYDLKIEIFSRRPYLGRVVWLDDVRTQREWGAEQLYCWKEGSQVKYRLKTGEEATGQEKFFEGVLEGCDAINNQEELERKKETIWDILAEKGHEPAGFMIYSYTSPDYARLSPTQQATQFKRMLNHANHFNTLVLSGDIPKETAALANENNYLGLSPADKAQPQSSRPSKSRHSKQAQPSAWSEPQPNFKVLENAPKNIQALGDDFLNTGNYPAPWGETGKKRKLFKEHLVQTYANELNLNELLKTPAKVLGKREKPSLLMQAPPKKRLLKQGVPTRVVSRAHARMQQESHIDERLNQLSFMLALVKLYLVYGYTTGGLKLSTVDFLLSQACLLLAKRPNVSGEEEEAITKRDRWRRTRLYALVFAADIAVDYPLEDETLDIERKKAAFIALASFKGKEQYSKSVYLTLLKLLLSIGKEKFNDVNLGKPESYYALLSDYIEQLSKPIVRLASAARTKPVENLKSRTRLSYIFESANREAKQLLFKLLGIKEEPGNVRRVTGQKKPQYKSSAKNNAMIQKLFTDKMLEELHAYAKHQQNKEQIQMVKELISQRKDKVLETASAPSNVVHSVADIRSSSVLEHISDTSEDSTTVSDIIFDFDETNSPPSKKSIAPCPINNDTSTDGPDLIPPPMQDTQESSLDGMEIELDPEETNQPVNTQLPEPDSKMNEASIVDYQAAVQLPQPSRPATSPAELKPEEVAPERMIYLKRGRQVWNNFKTTGLKDIVRFLTKTNSHGYNRFTDACCSGWFTLAEEYLKYAEETLDPEDFIKLINAKDEFGYTFYHTVVKNGCTEIVILLLNYLDKFYQIQVKRDLFSTWMKSQNNDGYTAFISAAKDGHTEIINHLLNYLNELYPNARDLEAKRGLFSTWMMIQNKYGFSTFIAAAKDGHTEIINHILNYLNELYPNAGDIEAKRSLFLTWMKSQNNHGFTVFQSVGKGGYTKILKTLLNYLDELYPNVRDIEAKRSLFSAWMKDQDNYGFTAFQSAAKEGHTKALKTLLNYLDELYPRDIEAKRSLFSAWMKKQDNYGFTAFQSAIKEDHTKVLKALLNYLDELYPNTRDIEEKRRLFSAWMQAKNNDGYTAFSSAAKGGNTEILKTLLKYLDELYPNARDIEEKRRLFSAWMQAKNNDGYTAFSSAAKGGYTEILKTLLKYLDELYPNARDIEAKRSLFSTWMKSQDEYNFTVFNSAAKAGHTEIINHLLNYLNELYPNANDLEAKRSLFLAWMKSQDRYGFIAFQSTAKEGHTKILKTLLNYLNELYPNASDIEAKRSLFSAWMESQNTDGYTAFITAVKEGHKEIINHLLNYLNELYPNASDIEAKRSLFLAWMKSQNNDGYTAFITAAKAGHTEIINSLLNYLNELYPNARDIEAKRSIFSSWVESKNNHGFTAFSTAANESHTEIINLFLNYLNKLYFNDTEAKRQLFLKWLETENYLGFNIFNCLCASQKKNAHEIFNILLLNIKGYNPNPVPALLLKPNNKRYSAIQNAAQLSDASLFQTVLEACKENLFSSNDRNILKQCLNLIFNKRHYQNLSLLIKCIDEHEIALNVKNDLLKIIKTTSYNCPPQIKGIINSSTDFNNLASSFSLKKHTHLLKNGQSSSAHTMHNSRHSFHANHAKYNDQASSQSWTPTNRGRR